VEEAEAEPVEEVEGEAELVEETEGQVEVAETTDYSKYNLTPE
jgi:hypothetical protein